jgi:hypothetical protein
VFDAAGGPRAGLAHRVSATLTAACVFLALALAVTLVTRTARRPQSRTALARDGAAT